MKEKGVGSPNVAAMKGRVSIVVFFTSSADDLVEGLGELGPLNVNRGAIACSGDCQRDLSTREPIFTCVTMIAASRRGCTRWALMTVALSLSVYRVTLSTQSLLSSMTITSLPSLESNVPLIFPITRAALCCDTRRESRVPELSLRCFSSLSPKNRNVHCCFEPFLNF